MADNRKAEELNLILQAMADGASKGGGGELAARASGKSVRAIERLVRLSYAAGVLDEYRRITAQERQELQKQQGEEIANAYYVKLDGRGRYITYKPKSGGAKRGGRVEHVNRSTDFVEALLTKIGAEYSFLSCNSRLTEVKDLGAPPTFPGFSFAGRRVVRQDSAKKYELFFLIECLDNIDAAETLYNVIDSVLLDVDENQSDYFSQMSYARLARDESARDDDAAAPGPDEKTRRQLNGIIGEIREQAGARRKLIEFLSGEPASELYRYIAARDRHFRLLKAENGEEKNAFNSTVTCRLMPIGVFLNEIENYRYTYTVEDARTGARLSYSVAVNPAAPHLEHRCPHCGKPLGGGGAQLVIASGNSGRQTVCCTACAVRCGKPGCAGWTLLEAACSVCGARYCAAHTGFCCETGDPVCPRCSAVFHDAGSGLPLSPAGAAVPGMSAEYVQNAAKSLPRNKLFSQFSKTALYRRGDCALCRTPDGAGGVRLVYRKKEDTRVCGVCGGAFYKDDVKRDRDGTFLCFEHGVACPCGGVVARDRAAVCAHPGCTQAFCPDCKPIDADGLTAAGSLKAAAGQKPGKKVSVGGKIYCGGHVGLCKTCGKLRPHAALGVCADCGGLYCADCAPERNKTICRLCAAVAESDGKNYLEKSSKTRRKRLNALPIRDKLFRAVGVFEDNADIVFVLYRPDESRLKRICRKYVLAGQVEDTGWKKT
ncbi:MAG: hypothetical protein LBH24_01555 [Clostridiales bacterium]|jgi:hypothetical protein|nr:hypothetical protein [Clostridiales bacterium]